MNLDNLTQDELEQLVSKVEENEQKAALELFPSKPAGYVKCTLNYLRYCKARLSMMDSLNKNRVSRADKYREECDKIYRAISDYGQW